MDEISKVINTIDGTRFAIGAGFASLFLLLFLISAQIRSLIDTVKEAGEKIAKAIADKK